MNWIYAGVEELLRQNLCLLKNFLAILIGFLYNLQTFNTKEDLKYNQEYNRVYGFMQLSISNPIIHPYIVTSMILACFYNPIHLEIHMFI